MVGTLTGLQWWIYDSFKTLTGLQTTGGAAPVKKWEKKFMTWEKLYNFMTLFHT